ncbi:MAG TPA: hypothetical protein EYG73_00215 [Arcobacter sp.]|nr:hypothetical protein [Arcobacter sp.]
MNESNEKFENRMNSIVYDFQYKMKLPFRYVMFTNLGLFAFVFNYLFFDSFALVLGITVMMSYPIFKLSSLRNYQIYRLPVYRLLIFFSKIFDKR